MHFKLVRKCCSVTLFVYVSKHSAFTLFIFLLLKTSLSWQLVKENLEQLDLNQQNDTNSEVDDEDVEVEIDEDVEVDIIYIHQRNYVILYAL